MPLFQDSHHVRTVFPPRESQEEKKCTHTKCVVSFPAGSAHAETDDDADSHNPSPGRTGKKDPHFTMMTSRTQP